MRIFANKRLAYSILGVSKQELNEIVKRPEVKRFIKQLRSEFIVPGNINKDEHGILKNFNALVDDLGIFVVAYLDFDADCNFIFFLPRGNYNWYNEIDKLGENTPKVKAFKNAKAFGYIDVDTGKAHIFNSAKSVDKIMSKYYDMPFEDAIAEACGYDTYDDDY